MGKLPGMTKEAVKDTLHAQPFVAFSFRLADGERIPVSHPEFVLLTQGGRTAIISTEGEHFRIIDMALITALEVGRPVK